MWQAVLNDADRAGRSRISSRLHNYLGHENRGILGGDGECAAHSYLVVTGGERFWNRFLELCRRAEAEQMVRFMTRKYIYNTEESPSNS